jgi:putative peptide zinc metalloprotease protein
VTPVNRPVVFPDSVVTLHDLVSQSEGDEYVVGRIETGEFVVLPEIGVRAIELLRSGYAVGNAEAALGAEIGDAPDLVEFTDELSAVGFVAAVDGVPVPGGNEFVATWPWLGQQHVQWVFSGPAKLAYSGLVLLAAVLLVKHPEFVPRYRDFFWTSSTSVVIVVNTAIFLVAIGLHEGAHLVAARSLGIPAQITLGTRLYNLVAQTNVSGLWSLPRRCRYRAYVAGMLWDLGLASVCIVALVLAPVPATVAGVLSALVLMIAVGTLLQLQLFMRTDVYFIAADLLRARNLFEDATVYLAAWARRTLALLRLWPADVGGDPLVQLDAHERRVVKGYAWFMIAGTLVAVCVFAIFVLPVIVVLLARATNSIIRGVADGDIGMVVDGGVTWLIEGGFQVVFLVVFFRTRAAWLGRLRHRRTKAQVTA